MLQLIFTTIIRGTEVLKLLLRRVEREKPSTQSLIFFYLWEIVQFLQEKIRTKQINK